MGNENRRELRPIETYQIGKLLVGVRKQHQFTIPSSTIDEFFKWGTKIRPNVERELREAEIESERDNKTAKTVAPAREAEEIHMFASAELKEIHRAAAPRYKREGDDHMRIAEALEEENDFDRARGEYANAGESYLLAGAYEKAAEAFEKETEMFKRTEHLAEGSTVLLLNESEVLEQVKMLLKKAAEALALGGFFDEALEMLTRIEKMKSVN